MGVDGEKYSQQPVFYNAIQKYGWDNFEHIILKDNLSVEEADYWEEYYIAQYKSTDKQFGYNCQTGGHSFLMTDEIRQKISQSNMGHICSEETKQKISKANKNKTSWAKGKHLTDEHKYNISQGKKGKTFSEEHKQHLKESHSTPEYKAKFRKSQGISVQCVETGDIFDSYVSAAEWCGLSRGSDLSAYFVGKQKSCGKHPVTKQPLHWIKIDKEIKE